MFTEIYFLLQRAVKEIREQNKHVLISDFGQSPEVNYLSHASTRQTGRGRNLQNGGSAQPLP